MKSMFIAYKNLNISIRTKEMLICTEKISSNNILVSPSKFQDNSLTRSIETKGGYFKYYYFVRESIKCIKKYEPDWIVLNDNQTMIILVWLYLTKKKIIIFYDSAELYIGWRSGTIKEFIAMFMRILEKKYLRYADVVFAANEERAKIMKDYYCLPRKPYVFDNIHRINDEYDLVSCNKKYKNMFENGEFVIAYSGGISHQRMTYMLVDAVGKLGKGFSLIIIGQAEIQEKKRVDKLIADNRYGNINYLGFVSLGELRYILSRADVSASMYLQDTINNINCASGKVYEGMFEGTPILTSENPPLMRLCNQYNVGVSNNDFKNGIIQIRSNYSYYFNNVRDYIKSINYDKRIELNIDVMKGELISKFEIFEDRK